MMTKPRSRRWTREETLIVFNLYCRIPFKDSNKAHPDVRHVAKLIGRTPDSVNMKIGNLGSLDPELEKRGIRGLRHTSRLDRSVWNDFHDNWEERIDESERLMADRERALGMPTRSSESVQKEGRDKIAERKVRENQPFFRKAILSAYENRCCVTGIDIEALLIASHIKPWADSDSTEKLNPQNGLCLNALHDRAFDRGLIAVMDNYTVVVSKQVRHSASDAVRKMLLRYEGRRINLPTRFLPRADLLAWHRDNIFEN